MRAQGRFNGLDSARLVDLANPNFQLPFLSNVVTLLFSLLPLDARLRAREVCSGWRFLPGWRTMIKTMTRPSDAARTGPILRVRL